MTRNAARLILVMLLSAVTVFATAAGSKRVYVFELDRRYWDVQRGETLGGIATALLPGEPRKRIPLMRTIFEMNPAAFIDGDPDRLRADTRLWLPGGIQTYAETPPSDGTVRHYDWGSIRWRER